MQTNPKTGGSGARWQPSRRSRGFLLLIILGMLAVLVILGLSFAEQGRVELMGARSSMDTSTADRMADTGLEMALRALADDRNVPSADNGGWNANDGPGWTSRWAYNHGIGEAVSSGGAQGVQPGPSHDDPKTYCESWQTLFWNEEDMGSNAAFGYNFQFDTANAQTRVAQRHPVDDRVMMDVWQRQPLQRVRRFRLQLGTTYGRVQIGISPRDGGINLNDVFEPGTIREYPGVYEQLELPSNDPNIPYAAPDRRTLEYVMGKRPEFVNRSPELTSTDPTYFRLDGTRTQAYANLPHGNLTNDDGIYNFRRYFEPGGQGFQPGQFQSWANHAWLTGAPPEKITVFYNAGASQPNRYNFEGTRYPLWTSPMGSSLLRDLGTLGNLSLNGMKWWPSGRFRGTSIITGDPYSGSSYTQRGEVDCLFQGFGFDILNPLRGGLTAATGYGSDMAAYPHVFKSFASSVPYPEEKYVGAGIYGFPKPQTFQRHAMAQAFNGRFMSDLHAAWYFGGAPGYTNCLGAMSGGSAQNWAQMGSSYSSTGIGSHWMPPTTHIWLGGGWGSGKLTTHDSSRGMNNYHGNMPPAKPAATYAYPLKKWNDDPGIANAQFLFNDVRVSLRAMGVQENWGLYGQDDDKGRFYDAINVNVSNFQVVYGLLTPEKIPSMLDRTVVAPHLHWKARMLDGAYKGMESFTRYNPNATPDALKPYTPDQLTASAEIPSLVDPPAAPAPQKDYRFGKLTNETVPYNPGTNPVVPFDPAIPGSRVGPAWYKYSLHRHRDPSQPGERIWGKMDFETSDPRTGAPADDVFTATRYDLSLYDRDSFRATVNASALGGTTQVARPDHQDNWADWFMQRKQDIPATRALGTFMPSTNVVSFPPVPPAVATSYFPEGRLPAHAGTVRSAPDPKPHPVHGLPNPDYLLMTPGSIVSYHWADQFRRYFPTVYAYPQNLGAAGAGPPSAPPGSVRLVDTYSVTHPQVNPAVPVGKLEGTPTDDQLIVPGIGKDEAWRLTRVGRKYQEIIADEIMDYQVNPWWPNPCVQLTEIAAPLSKVAFVSPTRNKAMVLGTLTNPKWWSYVENQNQAGIEYDVPDYFAYFNRFWVRGAGKYDRSNRAWAEQYRAANAPGQLANPSENLGIYPQASQYFGQFPALDNMFQDRVVDFPYNTLDDQAGSDWRYLTSTVAAMSEPNGRSAPARNHPFRNWADFVAFLGHLVYRAPMQAANRHAVRGVNAWQVCHGASAVARNQGSFFDGSRVAASSTGAAYADALKGCNAVGLAKCIVARDGYWPISGNYGEFPASAGPSLYPDRPAGGPWSSDNEWQRRVDEWRGRDAAGLRVEHNYVSEAAANDVLVSLSNARIGPIDFNGDGHIEMTRKQDVPDQATCWPGYPYHALTGQDPDVEYNSAAGGNASFNDASSPDYGVKKNGGTWLRANRNEILQGCVTLPIKFRSNTFRVSVLVELTDPQYETTYAVRRYSWVLSRVPQKPAGSTKVFGPYSGEFIQHSYRVMTTVDPDLSWLGTK